MPEVHLDPHHNDMTLLFNNIIGPVARKGYGSMALEGEGSNCFSITQLVGQKKSNNKFSKKNLFGNKTKYIGLQTGRTSRLNDYY